MKRVDAADDDVSDPFGPGSDVRTSASGRALLLQAAAPCVVIDKLGTLAPAGDGWRRLRVRVRMMSTTFLRSDRIVLK